MSQGFHPHVKVSFATALPVGLESVGEYAELDLIEKMDPASFHSRLSEVLPKGLEVISAREVPLFGKSMAKQFVATAYEIEFERARVENGSGRVEAMVEAFLAAESVSVERWTKNGLKNADVRPAVLTLNLDAGNTGRALLRLVLSEGNVTARPRDVLRGVFHLDEKNAIGLKVRKLDSFVKIGEELVSADRVE
jgi:radical SAM-linked protein